MGCKLQEGEYQENESMPTCNASGFFKYSEYKTNLLLNSTFDIIHATKCKQNCVSYKYEIAKKIDWNIKATFPGTITNKF